MARPSNKARILDHGLRVVRERGFSAAGVQEIVDAARVPKGSFYNHFESKDAFGAAVVDEYFARMRLLLESALGDAKRPPLARVEAYFDAIVADFEARGDRQGCMIGTLCAEANGAGGGLRESLGRALEAWRAPIAACLAEAQARGELARAPDADTLARFVLDAWQGAVLRTKITRDLEPARTFKKIVFGGLLAPAKRARAGRAPPPPAG